MVVPLLILPRLSLSYLSMDKRYDSPAITPETKSTAGDGFVPAYQLRLSGGRGTYPHYPDYRSSPDGLKSTIYR